MADLPDIAGIASLIGDRARARILSDLMAGSAFTATELARAAGVTKQTASAHLARLTGGGLVTMERQGRNRYFRLAHADVGAALEKLMGVAHRLGASRIETGPADPALRKARVCYDHLAGELGVLVHDSLVHRRFLRSDAGRLSITRDGEHLFRGMGIDVEALRGRRRPLCLACLDWSMRRHHLAGALGAALLERCLALKWARRAHGSRIVWFSADGERHLRTRFRH